MRGVPVNVNYRYLEDELVYLLDNSDAEALLFHGALGDRVAKVRDRAPNVKLWIQVDDGSAPQDFAVPYEQLIAGHDQPELLRRPRRGRHRPGCADRPGICGRTRRRHGGCRSASGDQSGETGGKRAKDGDAEAGCQTGRSGKFVLDCHLYQERRCS